MHSAENSKYAKTHEWAHMEGDTATVGISDHAQQEIGDIVFIDLPKVGQQVTAGQNCCVIESVKSASEIYAPVSGEVVEVNDADGTFVLKTGDSEGNYSYMRFDKQAIYQTIEAPAETKEEAPAEAKEEAPAEEAKEDAPVEEKKDESEDK